MTMSVSDPRVLLDAMGTMLGECGDIKGPHEVDAVISLMKDAEKLLSRYTFLNILRATVELAAENTIALETVNQFVKEGGCTILNKWLADAKGWENLPLIVDVLEILEAMPITIEALKQGNIGKLVKQLTRSEEKDIQELASSLLNKWMVLVKGKPKKSKKSDEQTSEESNSAGSPTAKRARENMAVGSKSNQPPEKKSKSLAEAKSSVTSVAKPPPKTKVIPALPKLVVMESSGFMNALITTPAPSVKKRKKVAPPPSPKLTYSGPLEEILQKQAQTHMQGEEKGSKQKEKSEEEEEEEKEQEKDAGNIDSPESQEGDTQNKSTPEEPTVLEKSNDNLPIPDPELISTASSSELPVTEEQETPITTDPVEPVETEPSDVEVKNEVEEEVEKKKKKKKMKSITWAEPDKLLVYHYYEPDEEERVNIQHVVNFHDAQQQEAIRERQRVEQAKRMSEDKMMEKVSWYRPKTLYVPELMEHGEKSKEKFMQKDRESKILAHLFFTKSSLPTTPGEPEPDANTSSTSSQPLIIPHDEKGTVYPPSKGTALAQPPIEVTLPAADPGVALPPALATLLANASKGAGSSPSNSAGGNSPSLSNVDVQALLKKLMEQGEHGTLEDAAERMRNELNSPRFPSPLMSQQLRVPGRLPVDQGPRGAPLEPHGLPEYRPRGLLRTPGPPDHPRFPGPHRGGPPRGRFHPPGGPRLRHPMPGQRMPGMGCGGMPNRYPGPDGNRDSGDEYYNDQYNFNDGDNPDGMGRGMPPRGRGTRGRGRGRPTCRHYMSPRGCLRGNACTFLHPGINGPPV